MLETQREMDERAILQRLAEIQEAVRNGYCSEEEKRKEILGSLDCILDIIAEG